MFIWIRSTFESSCILFWCMHQNIYNHYSSFINIHHSSRPGPAVNNPSVLQRLWWSAGGAESPLGSNRGLKVRQEQSLPPCITRLYLVNLICQRNQLSYQLIFSVNSESNCSLTLSLSWWRTADPPGDSYYFPPALSLTPSFCWVFSGCWSFLHTSSVFLFLRASSLRPLITELHLFRNTHFQWPVAMEPGRPPSSRESASLPLFSERGLRVCSYNVWCYENKKQGSSLENGNNTRAMQEVLERVLLLPCLFDPPCFLPSVFLLFSSLLSLLVFSVEVLLFLMNYLPTPQCWLRCMSEHL